MFRSFSCLLDTLSTCTRSNRENAAYDGDDRGGDDADAGGHGAGAGDDGPHQPLSCSYRIVQLVARGCGLHTGPVSDRTVLD